LPGGPDPSSGFQELELGPCTRRVLGQEEGIESYLAQLSFAPGGHPIRCAWQNWFASQDNAYSPRAIAIDPAGNAYIGGIANDVPTPAPGGIGHDSFLQKLRPDGSLQWSNEGPKSDMQLIVGQVALDGAGNLYALTTAVMAPSNEPFHLVKYDATGTLLWDRPAACCNSGVGTYSLVVDAAGTATVAADIGFGTTPSVLHAGDPGPSFTVASIGADGTPRWSHSFAYTLVSDPDANGPDPIEPAVALGPHGEILLAGVNPGSLDLGAGALVTPAASGGNIFFAAFDAAGALLWNSPLAGGYSTVLQLAGDGNGTVFLVGTVSTDIHFGAQQLAWPGTNGATFLARLSVP
jgi:hypothetical protein